MKKTYVYNGIVMLNQCRIDGDKCYLKLTKNQECVIDVDCMKLVSEFRWYASLKKSSFYTQTSAYNSVTKKRGTLIHRLILDYPDTDNGNMVDHIDLNTLNNRLSNLRLVTRSGNTLNKRPYGATSSYAGVTKSYHGKFWARIRVGSRTKSLGTFTIEKNAGITVAKSFVLLHGEEINPLMTALSKQGLVDEPSRTQLGLSSDFKGVYKVKNSNKWASHIKFDSKQIYIGSFKTEKQAGICYAIKYVEIHGTEKDIELTRLSKESA